MESSRIDLFNDMAERRLILKNNQNTYYSLIFKIDLYSATFRRSSRRVVSNDTAERRPILKNNQNTYYSFIFQNSDICSTTLTESSHRDFFMIWLTIGLSLKQKNNKKSTTFVLVPHSKQVQTLQTCVSFLLCSVKRGL